MPCLHGSKFQPCDHTPPEPKDSDFSKVRKESRWTVSYPWFVSFIVKTTTVSAWWYPVGFPPGKGGYNLSRVQQEREGGGGAAWGARRTLPPLAFPPPSPPTSCYPPPTTF